jgi:hypothetical protein
MGDGGQDAIWDSAGSATTIAGELERTPGHAPVTNLYYPDAGHYYFGLPLYYPFFTNASLECLDSGTDRTLDKPNPPRSRRFSIANR